MLTVKILKQGATEIYDYVCEEIKELTCPICKAIFEYTQSDCETEIIENKFYSQQLLEYNSSFCNPYRHGSTFSFMPPPLPVKSYLCKYISCPWCAYKAMIGMDNLYFL